MKLMKLETFVSKGTVAVLLLTSLFTTQTQADIAVVVSSSTNIDSISKREVKSIYLGKSRKLPNGQFAIPINQPEWTKLYSDFNNKIIDKSTESLNEHWSERKFSGKGTPPRIIDGDASIKRFLNSIPGTIGYIDSASVDSSVKVIYSVP